MYSQETSTSWRLTDSPNLPPKQALPQNGQITPNDVINFGEAHDGKIEDSCWFQNTQGKNQCFQLTVWKFQDFSATQILREINFGEFISLPFLGLRILLIY